MSKALSIIRIVLFDYDTILLNANSFPTIADLVSSFVEQLKASSFASAAKPLIVLAHSLGGIVFKEAFLALAKGSDVDRLIFCNMVGGVLFGVPSRGMETQALMAMVRGQPNEGLVRDLTKGLGYLQSLNEQFFNLTLPVWSLNVTDSPSRGLISRTTKYP